MSEIQKLERLSFEMHTDECENKYIESYESKIGMYTHYGTAEDIIERLEKDKEDLFKCLIEIYEFISEENMEDAEKVLKVLPAHLIKELELKQEAPEENNENT